MSLSDMLENDLLNYAVSFNQNNDYTKISQI